jgi:hypothetical protein
VYKISKARVAVNRCPPGACSRISNSPKQTTFPCFMQKQLKG